jgi:predicted esterase
MHYRARSYDPRMGRFTQKDPVHNRTQSEQYVYVENTPTMKVDPSGKIVVFVHGIGGLQSRDKIAFVVDGMQAFWKDAQKARQHVIHFLYGPAHTWDPWDQNSGRNMRAARALQNFVGDLARERDTAARGEAAKREPIYVLAYSNGVVVAALALRGGMRIDGAVFIGGALENDFDMSGLEARAPFIHNLWSPSDKVAGLVDGVGSQGFSQEVVRRAGNISQNKLSNVSHTMDDAGETARMQPDELRSQWRRRKSPRTIEWMTRLLGHDYYAPLLQSTTNSLSRIYDRRTGDSISQHESGVR